MNTTQKGGAIVLKRLRSFFSRRRRAKWSRQVPYFHVAGIEPLEVRRLLATVDWTGGGGDYSWSDPANWSGGSLPGTTDDVVISAPAGVTITHASGTDSIHSLSSANAFTLSGGLLSVATTLEVDNTFLISGGTLQNATVEPGTGSGSLSAAGSTLDGVTLDSNLQVVGGNSVTVKDGLTLNGTATLGGSGGSNWGFLDFSGSQTLGGTGTVVFGQYSLNALAAMNSGTVLTIGPGITLRGQSGYIGYSPTFGSSANVAVINQGIIEADTSGGIITVDSQSGTFNNYGALAATAGTLGLYPGGTGVINSGSITVGPTGTLSVNGNFSQTSTASMNVVLGGLAPNLFGHLAVTGSATLDGSLNVSEANGFSPITGDNFTILTFASATGQFNNYSGLLLPGNAALQPGYDPKDVTLTTVTNTTIAPDLRVTGLALSPANPQSSQLVTVNWNDANFGNGSTGASWTDHVVVVNTTTGQTIATADVAYDAAVRGNLSTHGIFFLTLDSGRSSPP